MGNDLETSEVLYSILFCITLKNAYLDYKGNAFIVNKPIVREFFSRETQFGQRINCYLNVECVPLQYIFKKDFYDRVVHYKKLHELS